MYLHVFICQFYLYLFSSRAAVKVHLIIIIIDFHTRTKCLQLVYVHATRGVLRAQLGIH